MEFSSEFFCLIKCTCISKSSKIPSCPKKVLICEAYVYQCTPPPQKKRKNGGGCSKFSQAEIHDQPILIFFLVNDTHHSCLNHRKLGEMRRGQYFCRGWGGWGGDWEGAQFLMTTPVFEFHLSTLWQYLYWFVHSWQSLQGFLIIMSFLNLDCNENF